MTIKQMLKIAALIAAIILIVPAFALGVLVLIKMMIGVTRGHNIF